MNNHKWKKSKGTLKTKKHFCSAEEKRRGMRRPMTKPHETEEEATIRRFHDAQRMARFRARKKKALEEAKALQTVDFSKVSVIPELRNKNSILQIGNSVVAVPNTEHFQTQWSIQNPSSFVPRSNKQNKYSQLLEIIERLGKDIKLMYAGSRTSTERLKVGIVRARTLIKECLLETEMYSKQ